MGSVAASSAHLRGAVACPTVSLAGGKMGAITASGARLQRTQGHAKVLSSPLRGDGAMVELLHRQPMAEMPRSRTRRCELDTQQAKVSDDSLLHLPLY